MRRRSLVWSISTCFGLLTIVAAAYVASARTAALPHAQELVRLVARKLVESPSVDPRMNPGDVLGTMANRIRDLRTLGGRHDARASIAREAADVLTEMRSAMIDPSMNGPLMPSGGDALRALIADEPGAGLLALLAIGEGVGRVSEIMSTFEGFHIRMVSCRVQAAHEFNRLTSSLPEAHLFTVAFRESRDGAPANDTLALTNITGQALRDVTLTLELTGRDGSTFSNLFFVDECPSDGSVFAICWSDRPGRETVRGVTRVRGRIVTGGEAVQVFDIND